MILGIGLSAKFVEKAGADLIIIYNSGRFRMAGRGSLAGMMPYGDANAIVLDMVSVSNHPIMKLCDFCPMFAGGHFAILIKILTIIPLLTNYLLVY